MKNTKWFKGHIAPVHKGWYERCLSSQGVQVKPLEIVRQYWNGKNWLELVRPESGRHPEAGEYYSDWRGLAEPFQIKKEMAVVSSGESAKTVKKTRTTKLTKLNYFVDGMNLAYWGNRNKGNFSVVLLLACELQERGFSFVVIFDASARYKLESAVYSKIIEAFPKNFAEITGKIRADDFLLQRAKSSGGSVISNDQFKDYELIHPWLKKNASRLVKGGVVGEYLTLPPLDIDAHLNASEEELYQRFMKLVTV